ncbi:MAG: M28 family peptidase [Bacteroidetes bacterium]|nr:M28 family peptidase [Bacteroidota bacterium]
MKKLIMLGCIFCSIQLSAQNKKAEKFAAIITPEALKDKLTIIAGAGMEGRETATEGQRKAAAFIEDYFKKIKLLPGVSGHYQMSFPVLQDSIENTTLAVNGKPLKVVDDYAPGSGFPAGDWTVNEIVFLGSEAKDSLQSNNIEVKDKWVMIVPDAAASFRVLMQDIRSISQSGAAGLMIVSNDFPYKRYSAIGRMYIPQASTSQTITPLMYISKSTAAEILKTDTASVNASFAKNTYPVNMQVGLQKATKHLQSSNVIGVLPGTDKKGEYVFVTAHYDHLGKHGDVIYYGADDDGSGTTSVLQIATAFAKARDKGYSPRRTIVFMTVSGEEKGLWGSEYYTNHPIFSLDSTSVDLNIDMIGRIDPERTYGDSTNYVYTIGEDKLSSDLMKISDSVNNACCKLELDRKFNDPNDPNRFYYRSDHFNFASKGVPIIFYFNGTHADYHRPTDTVDKINFDLMAKRAKLVFNTAWDMANRNDMLKRDIPLTQQ